LRFGLISPQTGYLRFLGSGRGPGFAGQTKKGDGRISYAIVDNG
jgi:hypothetical protein